eukprot:COSAG01_NODE_49354_length_373_cov_0.547445_1_plen_92_part_01
MKKKKSHCGVYRPKGLTRREMLQQSACGFGAVALSAMLAEGKFSGLLADETNAQGLHHPAKVKRVVYLYMDGGPSHVDTFDPKRRLEKENGK